MMASRAGGYSVVLDGDKQKCTPLELSGIT